MSSATDAQQIKSTSLYVGDLHPLVSDALLFTKFSEVGPVINARVCRDMVSRESLGYGYVNFREHKDAEQALDYMNYGLLLGRPFRLMWSQKDPTLRKSGKGNIFVKNLDKTISSTELYDTFEQFGKILSCKLATDEKGVSKGFGFVHFESEDSASRAINYVNGKEIRNRILFVGPFIPKSDRRASGSAAKFTNCYVKNFGEDMDDERFRAMFSKYGVIKSACVMKSDEGVSKGFGFVCFEEPSSAEAAVKEMDGQDFNGKALYVGRAQRKEERQEELKAKFEKQRTERQSRYATGVNLYVKNLDDSIDDEKLHEAFSKFGDITSAKVMREPTGVSRSFGFVCFRNAEHATLAVTNMNTYMLGNKPLYVAIAQRKEDRRAKLAADYQARVDQIRAQILPVPPHMPYLPTGPAANYPPNRGYFQQRSYMNSGPRWQQPIVASSNLQAYQTGAAGAANPNTQAYNQMMQIRGAAGAPASGQLAGRPMPGATGMNVSVPQFMRQTHNRQMTATGMTNANPAMQSRVSMPQQLGQPQIMQSSRSNAPQGGRADVPIMNQQQANNARFANQPRGMPQAQNISQPVVQQQKDLALDEDNQRKTLGTRLYGYIETIYPESAAKLTGVLLSLGVQEASKLFNDTQELEAKVNEAYAMLQSKNAEKDGKAVAK